MPATRRDNNAQKEYIKIKEKVPKNINKKQKSRRKQSERGQPKRCSQRACKIAAAAAAMAGGDGGRSRGSVVGVAGLGHSSEEGGDSTHLHSATGGWSRYSNCS